MAKPAILAKASASDMTQPAQGASRSLSDDVGDDQSAPASATMQLASLNPDETPQTIASQPAVAQVVLPARIAV